MALLPTVCGAAPSGGDCPCRGCRGGCSSCRGIANADVPPRRDVSRAGHAREEDRKSHRCRRLRGVVFRRAVRAGYATIDVAVPRPNDVLCSTEDADEEEEAEDPRTAFDVDDVKDEEPSTCPDLNGKGRDQRRKETSLFRTRYDHIIVLIQFDLVAEGEGRTIMGSDGNYGSGEKIFDGEEEASGPVVEGGALGDRGFSGENGSVDERDGGRNGFRTNDDESTSSPPPPPPPSSSSSSSCLNRQHRSVLKRECKLGDEVEITGGKWCDDDDDLDQPPDRRRKLVIGGSSCAFLCDDGDRPDDRGETRTSMRDCLRVVRRRTWDSRACQDARSAFYPAIVSANKPKPGKGGSFWTAVEKTMHHVRREGTATEASHGATSGGEPPGRKRPKQGENAPMAGMPRGIVPSKATKPCDQSSQRGESRRTSAHHGGGVGKRRQGEIVGDFLIQIFADSHRTSSAASVKRDDAEGSSSSSTSDHLRRRCAAIRALSSGTGVIDAAGGSGHVSLALAISGVRSTVVDPRPRAGCLPGRDRRALRRAIREYEDSAAVSSAAVLGGGDDRVISRRHDSEGDRLLLNGTASSRPGPVTFSTLRAWFGSRPEGIDPNFREGRPAPASAGEGPGASVAASTPSASSGGDDDVPVCSFTSDDGLLPDCSAVVALHPDEATGDIVDLAVEHRKPFLVVPCCVFSRLFPERRTPSTGEVVSTYEDLIEYLTSKHPSIRQTELPFEGANLALWSTFSS